MVRQFTIRGVEMWFDMKPGETREEAENRLIEVIENAGMNLTGWEDISIDEFDIDGWDDAIDGEAEK